MHPYLWAKKKESQGRMEWLPLVVHLEDTQGVMKKLWEKWLSPGQRSYIQQSMGVDSEMEAKRVALFVAATHDLGKASSSFQGIKSYGNSMDLDIELWNRLNLEGFGILDEASPLAREKSPHALGGYVLLLAAGVNEGIASVIGAHHGQLQISNQEAQVHIHSYPSNFFMVEDSESPIYKKWKDQHKKILDWALVSSGFETVEDIPKVNQPGLVLLSGLLIMADWIASNEHYFPLMDLYDTDLPNAYQRIEKGFDEWFQNDPWHPEKVLDLNKLYKARFDYSEPKPTQRKFGEVIENIHEPGILIFEAPMGMGKTEAALAGAEQLAYKTGRSGIFFGLPTQATSDGMFKRVKTWLDSITKDRGEKLSLRLNHGKSALNKDYWSLASNINMDETYNEDNKSGRKKSQGTVFANAWFAGSKTSSLDDFVVGTIDHFLLTALVQKHLALRHLGFTRKVVILDEIHAADAYMRQYLYKALTWAGAYKVPVIILSATLPADVREEMVSFYLEGRGLKKRQIEFPIGGIGTDEYPLMTYSDGNRVYQAKDFEREEDRLVKVHALEEEELDNKIVEAVEEGAIVGLIVNTVGRAQELGRRLEQVLGSDRVDILHSSFIATERVKKEKELLKTIGKDGQRPKGKLIVGTQVIEQSLDIDFDLMISDLAPMDLLIQRLGRLHRHSSNVRPKNYQEPQLYILGMEKNLAFDKGSLHVYGGYLLTRTQYFLKDEIKLPSDISPLVQKVYDSKVDINLKEGLKELYKEYKLDYERMIQSKEKDANPFCLDKPVLKPKRQQKMTLNNWMKVSRKWETEERARAQVRDIQDTIEVIAVKKIGDGYGFFGTDKDISKELLEDSTIARELAKQTLRLPIYYDLEDLIYELEKYNIKNLSNWQDQPWLEGSLGIIFDESHEFQLYGYKLKYSEKYGLMYERM